MNSPFRTWEVRGHEVPRPRPADDIREGREIPVVVCHHERVEMRCGPQANKRESSVGRFRFKFVGVLTKRFDPD